MSDSTPLARLLKQLDLQRLDRDLFLGDSGRGRSRLFGGLVAGQSVVAAARTVDRGEVHSLHAYFLRPGRHEVPIRYVVDRIRDGRSFTTRRVVAHQAGEAIFSLEASFAALEEGVSHQDPMPAAPPPSGLPEWDLVRSDRHTDAAGWSRNFPIEILACDPEAARRTGLQPAQRQVWMRPRGEMPEDPTLHAAVITFASDRGALSTATKAHGLDRAGTMSASLDHSLWFHRSPRWHGWLLYTTQSNVAEHARALISGTMYTEDGRLMVTMVQEGLMRTQTPDARRQT
jgi:acyl-CoA thioesterase-2